MNTFKKISLITFMFRNVVTGTIPFSKLLPFIVELRGRSSCCTWGGSNPIIVLSAHVHKIGEVEVDGG